MSSSPGPTGSLPGRAVASVVTLLAHARRVDKPMHPRGEVRLGTLRCHGSRAATGVAFLDHRGDLDVLARTSRSAGLPAPFPDVNGLAIRVPAPTGGHADVLLSGTGQGRLTRYVLAATTREQGGFLGTLLPYRSPAGPVHLGARAAGPDVWELAWAGRGPVWTHFATLLLSTEPGRDLDLSFDAVRCAPPGLEVYGWHRRLRGPSYAAARRVREQRRRRRARPSTGGSRAV